MSSIVKRLKRKPLRTILTLLQILLGSLAMTLALSAYMDAQQRQHARQSNRFDLIAGSRGGENSNTTTFYKILEAEGVKKLLEFAPAVDKVAMFSDGFNMSTVEMNGRLYQFRAAAYVDANYFAINDITVTSGSLFTLKDEETHEAVMLVSETAARILFPESSALGQTLNLMPDSSLVMYDETGQQMPLPPPNLSG